MFITKAETYLYKPLMHGGINQVVIDINDPVMCLIGQNGCGKSTLLKEIDVYPATSTDYEKGGYKEIHLTHDGSDYILRSEFNGAKGTHHFIKDEEQLNLSENSTTQASLCDSHFGVSELTKKIASGNILISHLRNTERKNLLAACYPSDLTFVLQHHKRIMSRIRDTNSNLKMLKTRALSLHDERIDDGEFNRLLGLMEQLGEFRMTADRWIHKFENEINDWKNHEAYRALDGAHVHIDHDAIRNQCRNLHAQAVDIHLYKKHLLDDPERNLHILETKEGSKREALAVLAAEGKKLANEISEFEAVADKNIDDELNDAIKELEGKEEYRKGIDSIKGCPIIPEQQINTIDLEKLDGMVTYLHSLNGEIWPSHRLNEAKHDIRNAEGQLKAEQNILGQMKERRVDLQRRFDRHQSGTYNPACALPCQLKSNFNEVLDEIGAELTKVKDFEATKSAGIAEMEISLKAQLKAIEIPSLGDDIVKKLENFFAVNPWTNYVLNEQELIFVLNNNPTSIYNRLGQVVMNSKCHYERVKLDEAIYTLSARIKILKESQSPAKELISKSLVDKKVALDQLVQTYEQGTYDHNYLKHQIVETQTLVHMYSKIRCVKENFATKANYQLIQGKIDLLQGMISDLDKYRRAADEKQSEIRATVRNQESIRIRLDQEITPNIEKLEKELKKLQNVESALSPNTGLPHVYMVRFINSVIEIANTYIRLVWNYDMEIMPLKESNKLDFNFPVRLNKNSKVKDISICSKGQKEIVDLCWTLGLYLQMGLGDFLPLKLDEPDGALSEAHRTKLLTLLSNLLRQGNIKQLFLINHNASLFTSFAHSQIVCLNPDGIVVPHKYNESVIIK